MADAELLTVAQVADVLQVTAQTIRNWIAQGVLPALRVGRAYRIRREDVDKLLDRAQAESDSLAAGRNAWQPNLWRLPRGGGDSAASGSVWDEDANRGLLRETEHGPDASISRVLDGIPSVRERAEVGRQAGEKRKYDPAG